MIRLTDDQSRELQEAGTEPVHVIDPHSARQFVLVSETDYEQIREMLRDDREQRAVAEEAWRNLSHLLKDEPW